MLLHHTGYVVKNAENPLSVQEKLNLITSGIDPIQEAKICLYKNSKNELIELIEPLNEKSPVWNFLLKRGNGFHHECFAATMDEIEKYTTEHQLIKIMGPVPAKIFDDKPVVFYLDPLREIIEFIMV